MKLRCEAQMLAFYEEDKEKSIGMIDQAININPDIQYARMVKFDICDRFDMIEEMENILQFFKQQDKNKYHNNIISFTSIIMAKKGDVDDAKSYFEKNIHYYTYAAKDKFKAKLERYRHAVPYEVIRTTSATKGE